MTKVVAFGAFVEVMEGVEGLVHISELAQHHVENPREVVNPGDVGRVKILEIDDQRRRLSLSLKRVEDQILPVRDGAGADQEAANGSEGGARRGSRARPVRGGVLRPGGPPEVEEPAGRRRAVEARGGARGGARAGGRRARGGSGARAGGSSRRARAPSSRRRKQARSRATLAEGALATQLLFVGLTGGIGSGKSEALAAFERLGAAVLSSDAGGARAARQRGGPGAAGGALGRPRCRRGRGDREAVAEIVFERPEELAWLEGVLFPRVGERTAAWRSDLERSADPARGRGRRGAAPVRGRNRAGLRRDGRGGGGGGGAQPPRRGARASRDGWAAGASALRGGEGPCEPITCCATRARSPISSRRWRSYSRPCGRRVVRWPGELDARQAVVAPP